MPACSPRAPLGRPRSSRYLPRPIPTSPLPPRRPDRTSLRSSTPSLASCRSDTNLVVRSPKLFSCRLGVPGGGGACGPASAIAPARRLPSARPGQAGAAATSASVPHRPAAGASVAASASVPLSPRERGAIPLRGYGRKTLGPSANFQPPKRTKSAQVEEVGGSPGSREGGTTKTFRVANPSPERRPRCQMNPVCFPNSCSYKLPPCPGVTHPIIVPHFLPNNKH